MEVTDAATPREQVSEITNPFLFGSLNGTKKNAGRVAGKEGFQLNRNVKRFTGYGYALEETMKDSTKSVMVKSWITEAWKWVNDADDGDDELGGVSVEERDNVKHNSHKAVPYMPRAR